MTQLTIPNAFALALQHHHAGRLREAEQLYRQILGQQPNHVDAMHNLATIAQQVGRNDAAVELYRRVISLKPDCAEAYSNLGKALTDQGAIDDAIAACEQAIIIRPDYASAHNNLGYGLRAKGQLDQAIAAYRRAIAFKPNYAEAHSNLGDCLNDKGQLDEAIAACRRAVALNPNSSEAHHNLASALGSKDQFNEAVIACRQAIALAPNFAEAYVNLANALHGMGRVDDAIAAYRKAISLKPDFSKAYSNLGNALKDRGELDQAIAACRRAIAINPGFAMAHNNLGNALRETGQLEEAIASFRRGASIDPENAWIDSNLVYAVQFDPGSNLEAIAGEARRWNLQHARRLRPAAHANLNDRSPERRLKIGYVSPDFHRHAECYFVVPLLQARDHDNFEIHCYSTGHRPDEITGLIHRASDGWHDSASRSDSELAERVRADQIDILVDLTMHMARHRLLTFARKPAPVQVTWLAYPGGTGLDAIDYRITDACIDRPGTAHLFSERAVHMPDSWIVYSPLDGLAGCNAPPAIANGVITFGSLNNPCKLNEGVLQQWARIMRAVARSRLSMIVPAGSHRERILQTFEAQGIARERLDFFPYRIRTEYLATYLGIDIGLDPFPYNGITTTCDALNMGVPVFTLPGTTPASRAGMSLLSAANLPELIAVDEKDLLEKVVALSKDLGRLIMLRATLRDHVASSPLMDGKRFARNLEGAYRKMWRTWCESASAGS